MDSVEANAEEVAGELDAFPKLDIRWRLLLDDARSEAENLSTDDNERARRKAGIVFDRLKEGREEDEVVVIDDIGKDEF
jgi:predicted amidophosphoribosyltransferase